MVLVNYITTPFCMCGRTEIPWILSINSSLVCLVTLELLTALPLSVLRCLRTLKVRTKSVSPVLSEEVLLPRTWIYVSTFHYRSSTSSFSSCRIRLLCWTRFRDSVLLRVVILVYILPVSPTWRLNPWTSPRTPTLQVPSTSGTFWTSDTIPQTSQRFLVILRYSFVSIVLV